MKLYFILIILLPVIGICQPGGGGGFFIQYVYDQSGKEIDIEHNQDYTLECFLLNDTLLATKNVYSKLENHFRNFQVDSMGYQRDYRDSTILHKVNFHPNYKYKGILLKPVNSYTDARGWNEYDSYRIVLSGHGDTMVIDYVKLIGENPQGISSKIESITFNSGYFQYKKENIYNVSHLYDTLWTVKSLYLNSYSPLITNEKRYLKEFQLTRVNERIKDIDKQIIALKESDEWKLYDNANKKYTLNELEKRKRGWIRYRRELMSEKKSFERQVLNAP